MLLNKFHSASLCSEKTYSLTSFSIDLGDMGQQFLELKEDLEDMIEEQFGGIADFIEEVQEVKANVIHRKEEIQANVQAKKEKIIGI